MQAESRNITKLHIVRFLSTLYFYHHVVSIYLQGRGLSFVEINSLWGIIVFAQAICEVPTGIIADKIGRKPSIILAQALQLSGELIFLFGWKYPHFIISSIAGGIGFSFLSGSFEAMMYDSLKEVRREHEMQKVVGFNGALSLLATVIGTFVGGVITARIELRTMSLSIIITSVFVGLSLFTAIFLKEPVPVSRHSKKSAIVILKESIGLLKNDKSLLRIVILALLVTPFVNYLMNLYPPFFKEINVSGWMFGPTLGVASLSGFFMSKYTHVFEKSLGAKWAVLLATVIPGVFYLLLFGFLIPAAAVPIVIVSFGIMQMQRPIFLDYMNRKIRTETRATVLSLISGLTGLYVALMGLVIGAVADVAVRYAFLLMGVVITISAFALRIGERHVQPGGN